MAVYTHEFLRDDQPIDAVFTVVWDGWGGDYGLAPKVTATAADSATRQTYYLHPFSNLSLSAEQLSGCYILSRKPLPTPLATARFDEAAVLESLRSNFRVLRDHGCRAEVMAKDLHTVQHQPRRLQRWVELARQARDEVYG